LARERRGLSGARKIVLDAALHGDWDLHIECTGFTKSKVAKFQGFKVSKILIACAIDASLKPHNFETLLDQKGEELRKVCSGLDSNAMW
jgi:hypothetical protein